MSIITTLLEDGLGAVVKLIPSYYLWAGGILLFGALSLAGKIWFDNKVKAEAQKEINAYIVTAKKDEADLAQITTSNNTKIQIQYQDRVVTVTKIVKQNVPVIQKVPDQEILSNGFVGAYNSIVAGTAIDPTKVTDATPSGISIVDALKNDNTNYGTCQMYKARADLWQTWYETTQAKITALNKKDSK